MKYVKRTILILVLGLMSNTGTAQDKEAAEKLVYEGIALHDKGNYQGAISKYDKALELDKDNLLALAEKIYSQISLGKYDEAITNCQRAIEKHPGDKDLKNVYVSYGNSLDALKKTNKAIEIYDEGIELFPDYYQLHFNKGITLAGHEDYDEAILSFQKSVLINPKHAGSHNALARLLRSQKKKIPALLAYCRFMTIESEGARAGENLESIGTIVRGSAEKTGKKSYTISISSDVLGPDTMPDGKPIENNFRTIDMLLSLTGSLNMSSKKKQSEVEQFISSFGMVCSTMKEKKEENYGFYWEYYAPYFIAMNEKDFLKTFAYIAYASSGDKSVTKWLKSHQSEIDEFYEWSTLYKWKTGK